MKNIGKRKMLKEEYAFNTETRAKSSNYSS